MIRCDMERNDLVTTLMRFFYCVHNEVRVALVNVQNNEGRGLTLRKQH